MKTETSQLAKPTKLYRYRSLARLEQELSALRDAYVYTSSFADMNDPMEGFYETGGADDDAIDALTTAGFSSKFYDLVRSTFSTFALASFSTTYENLPMWAYYAGNFSGICIEYDVSNMPIGDLRGQELLPVTYDRQPLPPITMEDMPADRMRYQILARISRKRIEWQHEQEWRFVAAQRGPKHLIDAAVSRVLIGPKADPSHVEQICKIFDGRPTEIALGQVRGFELTFNTIQSAKAINDCGRVGAGTFRPEDFTYRPERIEQLTGSPYSKLLDICRNLMSDPNAEILQDADISTSGKTIYLWVIYKLRDGRTVYHKRYLDAHLNFVDQL